MKGIDSARDAIRKACTENIDHRSSLEFLSYFKLLRSSDIENALGEFLATEQTAIVRIRAAYWVLMLRSSVDLTTTAIFTLRSFLFDVNYEIQAETVCWINALNAIPQELIPGLKHFDKLANDFDKLLVHGCLLFAGEVNTDLLKTIQNAFTTQVKPDCLAAASIQLRLGINVKRAFNCLAEDATDVSFGVLIDSCRKTQADRVVVPLLRKLLERSSDPHRSKMLICTLFFLDPSSNYSVSLIEKQLKNDDPDMVLLAINAISKLPSKTSERLVGYAVEQLTHPTLQIRENVATGLLELPQTILASFSKQIATAVEFERDLYVLELLIRLCVMVGERIIDSIIEIQKRTNNLRWVIIVAIIGQISDNGPLELLKIARKYDKDEYINHFISMYLSSLRTFSTDFMDLIKEMLSGSERNLQITALVAARNCGSRIEYIFEDVARLATGDDKQLRHLALELLQRQGGYAIRLLNKYRNGTFDVSEIDSIRVYLESSDDSYEQKTDLSWISDLGLIQLYVEVGSLFKEHGNIPQRKLVELLQKKANDNQLRPNIPTAESTVREKLERLEKLLSARWGRKVNLFVSSGRKPKRLSDDGIAFLHKSKAYLASIKE